ncbi:MAG TPA: peptide ABC transporter substrate-binding protein [Candidatus Acidoferrales bacterium]|nr:peptide ABC transporter substrate-binding protein [Candidatus Acidoferrales bacterium]
MVALLALSLLASSFASACTRPAGEGYRTDRLTVGRLEDFESLDPLLLSGSDSVTIGPLVFSYLVTVDGRGRLAPDLAEAVPSYANGGISRDGKTIVYRLRKNVLWQDGKPLTSSDVAFTFRQVMNPRNDVPARDVYDRIAGLDTPDARTVRIRLRAPDSAVLSYFFAPDGNYTVLPEHLLAGLADLNHAAFNAMPIGSGPFRVERWSRGDELRLVRFDRYFAGTPRLREITIEDLASPETLLLQTRTREIDATFSGSIMQLKDFQSIPGVRAVRAPLYGAALLAFNLANSMVADERVRRAIVEAADLPRIVDQASGGALTVRNAGRGLYGPDDDPSIPSQPAPDLAGANRLLDAAGWKRSGQEVRRRNGVVLAPALVYIKSRPEVEAFAVLLQARLRRAGIALSLHPYTAQLYGAPASAGGPLFGGKFEIVLLEVLTSIDPSTAYFVDCDRVPPQGFNITRYCNPAVDRANAAGLRTYDPRARAAASAAVQRLVARDLPFVPAWQQADVAAFPTDLSGVDPSAFLVFGNVARWHFVGAAGRREPER